MSIKRPLSPEVQPQHPWANDAIGRKDFGDLLYLALKEMATPLSVGLVGSWGIGKTTFLRMFAEHVKSERGPIFVHFNAWNCDYSGDPLVAFCEAIRLELERNDVTKHTKETEKFLKKAARLIGTSVASGLKTGGELVGKTITAIAETHLPAGAAVPIEHGITKAAEMVAEKIQEAVHETPNARTEFRAALKNVIKALEDLSQKEGSQPSTANACRLIIAVDELDRCRPDFAIRLLEVIKHYFDVEGLTFLLAYDGSYLESATRSLYGESFNAEAYLRRFVDVRFWLPRVDNGAFVGKLLQRYGFSDVHVSAHEHSLGEFLTSCVVVLGLTQRDAEQALGTCRLFAGIFHRVSIAVKQPCYFCCIARFVIPSVVQQAVEGTRPFSEIIQALEERYTSDRLSKMVEWTNYLAPVFRMADHSDPMSWYKSQPPHEGSEMVLMTLREIRRAPYGSAWREYLSQLL
jgi:MoxR-like ATPase